MLSKVSEERMHLVRWVLTLGWLLLILSLFYDPWSAQWVSTPPIDASCIWVQQECFKKEATPLGITIFWNIVIPGAIFTLLVFGHETWRRICPLSFLSQIPRALGWQRKVEKTKNKKQTHSDSDKKPAPWLSRNYPYVQFSWLFVGLWGRLLFFNANRLLLAGWLLLTIVIAVGVGYWFPGKSWCNYFCPMAPVQRVFSEPGGLFVSTERLDGDNKIPQSMCRTTLPDGQEERDCVGCQTYCIDIDAERSYWERLQHPSQAFLYYGYVGLLVGFFCYFYLYAGNWEYYFSGIWTQPLNWQHSTAGLYFLDIPRWASIPLVLGAFSTIGYGVGYVIERQIHSYSQKRHLKFSAEQIRHRIFSICTYFSFNFFFFFAGRSLIQQLPAGAVAIYDFSLVLLSTLWLTKVWPKSSELHEDEGSVGRFRKVLAKRENLLEVLGGKSLNDLTPQTIAVLAKTLPKIDQEKQTIYKEFLQETLRGGYTDAESSLKKLQQFREGLELSDDEHQKILDAVLVEDPDLLNPVHQTNLENQIRLNGYRSALERMTRLQQQVNIADLKKLRQRFFISAEEEEWISRGLDPEADQVRRSEYLIGLLTDLIERYRALKPILKDHTIALNFLWNTLNYKQFLLVHQLLENLASLKNSAAALPLAQSLGKLSAWVVMEAVEKENWSDRLSPEVIEALTSPSEVPQFCNLHPPEAEVVKHFEVFLGESNPLLQMVCLYLIAQVDLPRSQECARALPQDQSTYPEVQALVEQLLQQTQPKPALENFPPLEILVYLYNSDFFHWMQSGTLLSLAKRAKIRTYQVGESITEAGDTCRELLLLVQGGAEARFELTTGGTRTQSLQPGQVMDELDVLAQTDRLGTVVAQSPATRILAVPVDAFDEFLAKDPDFARRVMALESRQLQEFIRGFNPPSGGEPSA
jgi:hypothetical protein